VIKKTKRGGESKEREAKGGGSFLCIYHGKASPDGRVRGKNRWDGFRLNGDTGKGHLHGRINSKRKKI